MKKLPLLLAALLLLAGCAGMSRLPASQEHAALGDAENRLKYFQAGLPEKLQALNSVVFDYAGQKFLGIGFVEIDRRERSFRVICLNPMGVKLFDLSGDDRGTTMNFAIEPLARVGDIAAAVGHDIRRIYFDLLPRANALPRLCGQRLIYGGGTPEGYQEHIFAGAAGDLVEKRFYDDQLISWRVTYFDYHDKEGQRSPRGSVITDYKRGYQLTVREKEQNLEKDQE